MKRKETVLLFTVVAVGCLILLMACDAGRKTGGAPESSSPVIASLTHSSCKTEFADRGAFAPTGETCLQYEYDGASRLTITHIDLWANCCLLEITADVSLVGDTIILTESETLDNLCRCFCLYDLNLTVDSITPGIYHIRVGEIYEDTCSSCPPLAFTVDLTKKTEGKFCVERVER